MHEGLYYLINHDYKVRPHIESSGGDSDGNLIGLVVKICRHLTTSAGGKMGNSSLNLHG